MVEPGSSGADSAVASTSKAAAEASGGATSMDTIDITDPAVLASMTADELKKFIDTGRTGRRNAVPDVTQPEAASTSTAGVAEALETLTVRENHSTGENPS